MADLVSMRADAAALRQDIETILATEDELTVAQVADLDAKREKLETIQEQVHRAESVDAARQAIVKPTFRFPSGDKFTGTRENYTDTTNSRMQFIDNLRSAMRGERIADRSLLSSGNAADLMPVDLQGEMVRLLNSVSAVRKAATIRTYENDVEIPAVSARATITAYTGEGTTFDNFDPDFGKIRIRSFKSAAETLISDEVLQDSRGSIVDELLQQHAEAHGYFFETKFCTGNAAQGASNPDGLLATTGWTNHPNGAGPTDITATGNTFAEVTYDELVNTAYGMEAAYWGLPKSWIVGPAMFRELLNLADGNGRPLLLPQATGTAQESRLDWNLLGYPVYVSDAMPAQANSAYAAVVLSRESFVIADRRQVTSMVDPYSNGADGLTAFRSYYRTDGRWLRPASSARLKLASA